MERREELKIPAGVMFIFIIITSIFSLLNRLNTFIFLENSVIRFTAGALIIVEGLINLSSLLPVSVYSIMTTVQTAQLMERSLDGMVFRTTLSTIIPIFLLVVQIAAGIYLVKFYKQKSNVD